MFLLVCFAQGAFVQTDELVTNAISPSPVAISDNLVVVADDSFNNEGAFVFRTTDGGHSFTLIKKLMADDPQSVAISSSTSTIIVGTKDAVYVFTDLELTRTLTSDVPSFGRAVALNGDLVVGAAGAVYVYDESFRLQELLIGSGDFGSSVAISDDLIVVGAPDDDAAFVYQRTDLKLQAQKLTSVGGGRFGSVVAVSDAMVVVSAPWNDAIGPNSGAVFIFTDDLTLTRRLTPYDWAPGEDFFGLALAMSGDLVAVGARNDDRDGIPNAGSVYIYGPGNVTHKVTAGEADSYDRFGSTIAMSCDVMIVGTARGSALSFVYPGCSTGSNKTRSLMIFLIVAIVAVVACVCLACFCGCSAKSGDVTQIEFEKKPGALTRIDFEPGDVARIEFTEASSATHSSH